MQFTHWCSHEYANNIYTHRLSAAAASGNYLRHTTSIITQYTCPWSFGLRQAKFVIIITLNAVEMLCDSALHKYTNDIDSDPQTIDSQFL